jgi:hypothetical protein
MAILVLPDHFPILTAFSTGGYFLGSDPTKSSCKIYAKRFKRTKVAGERMLAASAVLLAAAGGSLAGTPMQRVLLQRSKAIDGSPALYYGALNTSSTKWVIWIQGGGICQSLSDCQGRANSALGSSKSVRAARGS